MTPTAEDLRQLAVEIRADLLLGHLDVKRAMAAIAALLEWAAAQCSP